MPIQEAASAATHPLANTAASWLWLIPLLPLAGFVINGLLSLTAAFHAGPLFNEYLLAFEVTSVLLLAAIVGAVLLGKRSNADAR